MATRAKDKTKEKEATMQDKYMPRVSVAEQFTDSPNPEVVAFAYYTRSTPYVNLVPKFIRSCRNVRIRYSITAANSQAGWEANCAMKPYLILDQLQRMKDGEILIYTDIDSCFNIFPPIALPGKWPVDAEGKPINIGFVALPHTNGDYEVLSGSIYILNTPLSRHFIRLWMEILSTMPEKTWDQKAFGTLIHNQGGLKTTPPAGCPFHMLGIEYAQIFDHSLQSKEPVITHYQASRKLKDQVGNASLVHEKKLDKDNCTIADPDTQRFVSDIMPEFVDDIRVRKLGDDKFYVPNVCRETAAELDKVYVRKNTLNIWLLRKVAPMSDALMLATIGKYMKALRLDAYRTIVSKEVKTAYVIGKGPSLDLLEPRHFTVPEAPVFCCNQSIRRIESLGLPNQLFMVQQDHGFHTEVHGTTIALVSERASGDYLEMPEYVVLSEGGTLWTRKYVYSPYAFGERVNSLTARMCVKFAKKQGINYIIFYGFDACIDRATFDYAPSIGHSSDLGGPPNRFKPHKEWILDACRGIDGEFVPVK